MRDRINGVPGLRHHPRIANMRGHPRQYFGRLDRLGHIIQPACLEALDDMLGLGQSGHEHHWHMTHRFHLFNATAGLEAIDARHHRVQQNDVGHDHGQSFECRQTIGGDQYRIACVR